MSTYTVTDVRAWLGGIPETADVTDEQCATIASAWDALDHMLSDSDPSGPERADAASGAAAYVLGDLDLHTIGQRVRDARETLDGQLGILHGVMKADGHPWAHYGAQWWRTVCERALDQAPGLTLTYAAPDDE